MYMFAQDYKPGVSFGDIESQPATRCRGAAIHDREFSNTQRPVDDGSFKGKTLGRAVGLGYGTAKSKDDDVFESYRRMRSASYRG